MEKWKMRRLSVFLAGAALILFLILDVILAVSAHVVTVHEGFENYPMNELVVFWRDNVFAIFRLGKGRKPAGSMVYANY